MCDEVGDNKLIVKFTQSHHVYTYKPVLLAYGNHILYIISPKATEDSIQSRYGYPNQYYNFGSYCNCTDFSK